MYILINPQFLIVRLQILFSVTGLEFSFTQAPSTMKSVLQALWLLTVTFGNIIVVIIAEIKLFDSQAKEFFLFTALMAVDILLFIYLAKKYTYRTEMGSDDAECSTSSIGKDAAAAVNGTMPNINFSSANLVVERRNMDKERLDASPKCLKQRSSTDKTGIDNYGYADI